MGWANWLTPEAAKELHGKLDSLAVLLVIHSPRYGEPPMRLALLLTLLICAPIFAEEVADDPAFNAANKLFAEKKFAEALVQYKKLIEKDPKSAGVLYNAGTAA